MRTGLSIALVLALSIPPRPAVAGGLSRDQLATLDRLHALENLGKLKEAYALAVQEFTDRAASASYRRSVINRGQVIAIGLHDQTKDVTYLCTAVEMLRVYQAELIESPEDRVEIPPTLERLEVRATEAAAPCARPSPPPHADAASSGNKAPPAPDASPPRPEGPKPLPPVSLARRSRPQIAVGSTLLIAGAGLAAGFIGCLVASGHERAQLSALGARAEAAGRNLTNAEWAEAATADERAIRLTRTGTILGVFAAVGVLAGLVVLVLPPRPASRVQARLVGAGVRLNF